MTIKEIAQLAGVSSAAVSRYFHGGSLSQPKREAIQAAIEQTGYRPDAAAQSLRTKSTDYIGFIVPKISSDAVSRVTAGVTQELSDKGYLCLLANTDNDPQQELTYLELFQSRCVAGILLMATVLTPRHQEMLRQCTVPVVVIGQRSQNVPCVYHDDFNAARELMDLSYSAGPDWEACLHRRHRSGCGGGTQPPSGSARRPDSGRAEPGHSHPHQLFHRGGWAGRHGGAADSIP